MVGKRFYKRLRAERSDGADLATVVVDTVKELTTRETDENRPGMLLGKIQSSRAVSGFRFVYRPKRKSLSATASL